MIKNINVQYNSKYINSMAEHLCNVPKCWLQVEIEDCNIIHPTGQEKIEDVKSKAIRINPDMLEEEIKENHLEGEGGIYYIFIPKSNCVYVGETLDFERRFKEHTEALRNKTHYNKKLANAYLKSPFNQFYFYVLESGAVSEYNKAEFKIYCLKRENYYKELFRNSGNGLFNTEDTLHELYIAHKKYALTGEDTKNLSGTRFGGKRPKSMAELEDYTTHEGEYCRPSLKEEKARYNLIQTLLQSRR